MRSRRGALNRKRLSKLIGAARCAWIWGPAGSGKTTLVHAHFGAEGGRARTHHLDARDRDPSQLFARLAALFPATEQAVTEFPGPQFADPLVYSRRFWMDFWAAVPAATTLI